MIYLLPQGSPLVLTFDVSLTGESITFPAEITEHPVEKAKSSSGQGNVTSIVDHTMAKPIEIELKGFVTMSPMVAEKWNERRGTIGPVNITIPGRREIGPTTANYNPVTQEATLNQRVVDGAPFLATVQGMIWPRMNPVREMILRLNDIRLKGTLLALVTKDLRYDNLGLGTFTYTRTSGGAEFDLELKQVTLVESRRVTAPLPKEPRGLFNDQKGPQEGTDPFFKEGNSFAKNLSNGVKEAAASLFSR